MKVGESQDFASGSDGWVIRVSRLERPSGYYLVEVVCRGEPCTPQVGHTLSRFDRADREIERLRGFLANPSDESFWPSRWYPGMEGL
jgi:hypothetical protein